MLETDSFWQVSLRISDGEEISCSIPLENSPKNPAKTITLEPSALDGSYCNTTDDKQYCYRLSCGNKVSQKPNKVILYKKITYNSNDSLSLIKLPRGNSCLIDTTQKKQAIWLYNDRPWVKNPGEKEAAVKNPCQEEVCVTIDANNAVVLTYYPAIGVLPDSHEAKTIEVILDDKIGGLWSLKRAKIFSNDFVLYNERELLLLFPYQNLLQGPYVFCVKLPNYTTIYIDATKNSGPQATPVALIEHDKSYSLCKENIKIALEPFSSCYDVSLQKISQRGPTHKSMGFLDLIDFRGKTHIGKIIKPGLWYVTDGTTAASIAIPSKQFYRFSTNSEHIYVDGYKLSASGVNTVISNKSCYDISCKILIGLLACASLLICMVALALLLGYFLQLWALLTISVGTACLLVILCLSSVILFLHSIDTMKRVTGPIAIVTETQALQDFFGAQPDNSQLTSLLTISHIKLLLEVVRGYYKDITTSSNITCHLAAINTILTILTAFQENRAAADTVKLMLSQDLSKMLENSTYCDVEVRDEFTQQLAATEPSLAAEQGSKISKLIEIINSLQQQGANETSSQLTLRETLQQQLADKQHSEETDESANISNRNLIEIINSLQQQGAKKPAYPIKKFLEQLTAIKRVVANSTTSHPERASKVFPCA